MEVVFCESKYGYQFISKIDKREYTRVEGIIGLSRTLFVCVVLSIGSVMFSQDANNLVLIPLERMLEKVKLIASNPLAAASDEVEMAGVFSMMAAQEKKENKSKKAADAEYETAILEKAIVKIGHLLALGFGEAGSGIIAKNMQNGGDINPMMEGVKMHAIFGFCDIRSFTETNEVLQNKIMLFVNQVAEVVHS